MNRINIYTYLAILFCIPLSSFSQVDLIYDHSNLDDSHDETVRMASQIDVPTTPAVITAKKERDFNLKIWDMVRTYENCAGLSTEVSKKKVADFKSLFNDGDVLLYNDLLGLSFEKRLTVAEYIELMTGQAESVECIIRNVNFGEITEDESFLYRKVTFDKELSYFNECGVSLSSYNYYGKDYNEEMVFVMSKSTGECDIFEINGKISTNKRPLGKDFVVIRHTSKYDLDILANDRYIQFDPMKQAFFDEVPNLVCNDDNVKIDLMWDTYCEKIASIKYTPIRLRIKPRISFSLGNYYSADVYDGDFDVESSGIELGVDFGYIFPSKKKTKLGVFLGVALSTSNAILCIKDLAFSYNTKNTNADVDGDIYLRHYEFSRIDQELTINSFVVPAYFEYERLVSKRLSMYAQLGAKVYLNLDKSISSSADAFIYGVYPQYGNMYISESYLNCFGQKRFDEKNFDKSTQNINKLSYDMFSSIGLKIALSQRVNMDVSISYQDELGKTLERQSMTDYQGGGLSLVTAPASYTVSGGEVIKNPIDAVDLKRHFWGINFGLIFKL